MRRLVANLLFVVMGLLPGLCWGHGFSLTLSGNTLIGSSQDSAGTNNTRIFVSNWESLGGVLSTDHGGAGSALFGNGKDLSFEVTSFLYYSSGGIATPSLSGIQITIEDNHVGFDGPIITVTGSSGLGAGFPISGNDSHEFYSELTRTGSPSTIPAGVYGLSYIVKGKPTGGSNYVPTQRLVTTWYTPNFDLTVNGVTNINNGSIAIFNATVPEPGSAALAAVASVSLAVFGWKSRRRRDTFILN